MNNPYSVKWPSHFLQIGYNSGFYYEDYQDGVPILRLKKLNNKNPTLIMKYSKYKEPFLPRNFKFIKIPEMIYADDSKINNTIIFK